MKIKLYIVAEIGSTTTYLTLFVLNGTNAEIVDQTFCETYKNKTDVLSGFKYGFDVIRKQIRTTKKVNLLACSSAAGGLSISVHGLMKEMTVKAAKAASENAGGIVKLITSGKLTTSDIRRLKEINPNIIIIAGGTDYGERETTIFNASKLKKEFLHIPIIYCGNIENQKDITSLLPNAILTENVFPNIDELNIDPIKKVIQETFETHIIHKKGMSLLSKYVSGKIIPTPAAVMNSAKILYEIIGDLLILDVGGSTTDVFSVTKGSDEINSILVSPEPFAKRTVEGDLGVYINLPTLIKYYNENHSNLLMINPNIKIHAIPKSQNELKILRILTKEAVQIAIKRHAGIIKHTYSGNYDLVAYGKDLSKVSSIIGTGGALIKNPKNAQLLHEVFSQKGFELSMFPKNIRNVYLDKNYILAAVGMLSLFEKKAATLFLQRYFA